MDSPQITQYLAFLAWCLNPTDDGRVDDIIDGIDWHELKLFAKKQRIVYVYWYAMQKHLKLKDNVVLDWMSSAVRIPRASKKVYQQCVELSEYFKKEGFRTCILKGQGNALHYPDPYTRNPGDIDIWVEGGRDKVVDFICRTSHPQEVVYHDIDFPYFDDINTEAHFIPAYLENPFLNKKLQRYISTHAEEQFSNEVQAPDGIGSFHAPTLEFNLIYQLLHLDKHLRTEGIGLRQLVDYYYLLRKYHESNPSDQQIQAIRHDIKEFRLGKFTGAVMYIMHNILRIDKECLLAEPNEKEGKFLLEEMMKSGDMGRYDTRLSKMHKAKGIKKFIELEKFKLRLLAHYPQNAVWMPFHDLYVHYFYIKKYQKKYNLSGKIKKQPPSNDG